MDVGYQGDGSRSTQDLMAQEARLIVDVARERGVVLRLLGGLAVSEYCGGLATCRREHGDLDMVSLRRQITSVVEVFGELGYRERMHVRLATHAGQAQFLRGCVHGSEGSRPHRVDWVDVFLDSFRLDHRIDLRDRLTQHPYAVPLTDALAAKLQMHAPEPRDTRDAVMLLVVCEGEGAGPDQVDPEYLGKLCARDWGLFYDVTRNLQRCVRALDEVGLQAEERAWVGGLLASLTGAVDAAPKTLRWRTRAGIGTRRRWWTIVEEQEEPPS